MGDLLAKENKDNEDEKAISKVYTTDSQWVALIKAAGEQTYNLVLFGKQKPVSQKKEDAKIQ